MPHLDSDDEASVSLPASAVALPRLAPLLRDVLAALALGAVPRPRHWAFELLADPGLRCADSKRPTQEAVRLAIATLRDGGWIVEDARRAGYWSVAPLVHGPVYGELLQRVPLERLRTALALAEGESMLTSRRFGDARWAGLEPAVARLRLEAFSGAAPAELEAFAPRLPWGVDGVASVLDVAVADCLDESLLQRLHPDVQCDQLLQGLATFCTTWREPPGLPLLALAQDHVAHHPQSAGTSLLRCLLAEHAVIAGHLDEVESWMDGVEGAMATPLRLAFRGAVLCLRGQWAGAEQALDEALLLARKATGKRRGVLPAPLTTLYALALLAQQTPAHLHKALKFCLTEGGKREPVLDGAHGFIALAVQMRLGETPRDVVPFQPYASRTAGGSPLDLWRWLMRAYLKEGTAPEPLSAAELESAQRLKALLDGAGLLAWYGLLDGALQVLSGEPAPLHFFVPAGQERWQVALDALQAVTQPADAPAAVGEGATRLLWLLDVDRNGAVDELTVCEQKRGQRGWGKPKDVPLSRLQRSAEALAPHDAVVARTIKQDTYSRSARFDLASAVVALVGHPVLAFADAPEQLVTLTEAGPELDVINEGERLRVRMLPAMHVPTDDARPRWAGTAAEQKEIDALRLVTVLRDGPQRARLVCLTPAQKRVAQLLGTQGLEIPKRGAAQLQQVLQGLGVHFRILADDAQAAQAARELPTEHRLRAELQPVGDGLQLRLVAAPYGEAYASDGPRLIPGQGRTRLVTTLRGEALGVQRDLAREREHLLSLLDTCPMLAEPAAAAPCEWLIDQADDALTLLERLHQHHAVAGLDWPQGRPVRVEPGALRQLTLKVQTKQDWLGLQGELRVDEALVVSLQQLISFTADSRSRFMPLGDGRYLALTQELRDRVDDLAAVTESQSRRGGLGELRLPAVAAPWLQEALQGAQAEVDPAFTQRLQALDDARGVVPALPAGLQATLRPYQEEGFEWAMRLAHAGLGAVLADDMGLGKTLQALAVLLARAPHGPTLVVAPTSLLGNWRAEARRFAPTLKMHVYAEGGAPSERTALIERAGKHDVVLVSYPMLHIDGAAFAQRHWTTLVLDEAQAIKNAAAKRSQAVFELKAGFRLALSGTPIENRLGELWSLMHACNPGLLGTQARFNERFAALIERQRDRHAQRILRRLIAPFILRRTKAQVLDDLPPRTELVLHVTSDEQERAHYEALRRDALAAAERSLSGDAPGQAQFNILAGLTRLRRAACDPRLVSPELKMPGAKVQAFAELAAELVANGHKALVFSQFVDFLALLREPLDAAGIAYQYLDGGTPQAERTRRVDAFQAGEGEFFLISLKAGGFGLNLTVADYVVIADPWWNPAAEDQASGRAHRIGQQRPVTVYRLVNEGTLEERILTLHQTKRELADSVLDGVGDAASVPLAHELVALMRDEAGPASGDEG